MSRRPAPLPLPGVRWRGLTVQLFVTLVLPLTGLLIAVALGAAYLHQQAMRDLVGRRDRRAALYLARALEEQLEHRAASVASVATLLQRGLPVDQVLDARAPWRTDLDAGLALVDSQGQVQAAVPTTAWWHARLPAQVRAWSPPGPAFSPALNGPEGGPLVLVAVPQPNDRGWVVAAFHIAPLAQDTLQAAFPEDDPVHIRLFDATGMPLFSQPREPDTTAHAALEAALQGDAPAGVVYVPTPNGEHVVAFARVRPVQWVLVVEENWAEVANPWLHTTQLAPLLLVPVLLLALVALWFGARQVVEPLQRLEAQAAALAWGDYQALDAPVGGIEEIRRLQRTLRHMAHKVRRAQQALHGYIGAITQGQEEERRRLARELHDETLQALIALQQRLQLLRRELPATAQAQRAVAELQHLTERTIHELRRMTHDLRPLYLEDLGLIPALETLAREVQAQHPGLQVEVLTQGPVRRLEPAQELALYRIAQEALRNIARHAQATWAQVRLVFGPQQVRLEIQDNGRGFQVPDNPAEFAHQGHYGLLGMYERAELIAARLQLHSEPGQGTRVVLVLPLDTAPGEAAHDAAFSP